MARKGPGRFLDLCEQLDMTKTWRSKKAVVKCSGKADVVVVVGFAARGPNFPNHSTVREGPERGETRRSLGEVRNTRSAVDRLQVRRSGSYGKAIYSATADHDHMHLMLQHLLASPALPSPGHLRANPCLWRWGDMPQTRAIWRQASFRGDAGIKAGRCLVSWMPCLISLG